MPHIEIRDAGTDYLPIEIPVSAKTNADLAKLELALSELVREDASFRVSADPESGQTRLKGMGELHLDMKIDILRRNYDIAVKTDRPQVAYRETLGRPAEIDYAHKQLTRDAGQFARLKLSFEPLPPGSGFVFENEIVGDSIPMAFIPGVENGIKVVMRSGPLVGFPVIDFKVRLLDGAFHDVDSSALTFEIASTAAFHEAAERAQMKLLEPIMKVEVFSPEDCVGTVIGDLLSRRAVIESQQLRSDATVINAMAPLAEILGYMTKLRSMTQNRARCSINFVGLAELILPFPPPPLTTSVRKSA